MEPLPYLDTFTGTGTLADHTSDSGHTYIAYGGSGPAEYVLTGGYIANASTGLYANAYVDFVVTPNYDFSASVQFQYLTQINFNLPGGSATLYSSGLGPGSSSFIASNDSEDGDVISVETSIAAGSYDVAIKFRDNVVTISLNGAVILECPSEQYSSVEPEANALQIAMIRYMGSGDSSIIFQASMTGDSDVPPFWTPLNNCYEIP